MQLTIICGRSRRYSIGSTLINPVRSTKLNSRLPSPLTVLSVNRPEDVSGKSSPNKVSHPGSKSSRPSMKTKTVRSHGQKLRVSSRKGTKLMQPTFLFRIKPKVAYPWILAATMRDIPRKVHRHLVIRCPIKADLKLTGKLRIRICRNGSSGRNNKSFVMIKII